MTRAMDPARFPSAAGSRPAQLCHCRHSPLAIVVICKRRIIDNVPCSRNRCIVLVTHSPKMHDIKALVFDVFGTLVDWRTSIARDAQALLSPLDIETDWLAFADAWRAQYQPAMEQVRSGHLPFSKLD